MVDEEAIAKRWEGMKGCLDERQRRLWAASEARSHGHEGRVARGNLTPGLPSHRRDSLPSPGSSHQPYGLGLSSLPPGAMPRLIESTFLVSRPLRSTPTPASRGFTSYYGPVRQRAPRPVLNASGFCRWHAPSRDPGPTSPGRRIDARLLTFRARAADQAHAASTPGTTWPINRDTRQAHPEGRSQEPPLSMPSLIVFRRLNNARPPGSPRPGASGTSSWSPPDASSRAFSLVAHHDSLQPTQHQGGLTPTPEGRRRRANNPPSLAQHRL